MPVLVISVEPKYVLTVLCIGEEEEVRGGEGEGGTKTQSGKEREKEERSEARYCIDSLIKTLLPTLCTYPDCSHL